MRALDALIHILICVLVLFAALAFGAVHAWSELIALGLAGAIAVCLAIRVVLARDEGLCRGQIVIVALFIAWAAAELVPLPATVAGALSPQAVTMRHALLSDVGGIDAFLSRVTLSIYHAATRHDLRIVIIAATVFIGVVVTARTEQQIRRLLTFLAFIGGAIAILALSQDLTRTHHVFWRVPTDEPARSGPFFNHSHYAQFMNLSIGLAAALLLIKIAAARQRGETFFKAALRSWWLIAIILIGAGTVVLSLSRGGFVSMLLAGGLSLIVLLRRRPALAVIALALIIAAAIVTPRLASQRVAQRIESLKKSGVVGGRMQMIRDTLTMWSDFPLAGTGLGTYEFTFPSYDHTVDIAISAYAENEYAQTAAETGIIGIALVGIFVAGVWWNFAKCLRHDATPFAIAAIGLGYGLAAVMMHSLSDFGQHVPAVACLSAVTCGLLVNLGRAGRASTAMSPWKWPMRFAAAAAPVLCLAVCVPDAIAAWRAETHARRATVLLRRIDRKPEKPSEQELDELLDASLAAADAQPDNILFRHQLNLNRWRAMRMRGDSVGAFRRLVASLHESRRICPTYGEAPAVAGRIENQTLGSPAGAYHLRLAQRLMPNDPIVCIEVAKLEARLGAWDGVRDQLRRAFALESDTLESIVDFYLHDANRPDLLAHVLDDQWRPLLLMPTYIRKYPGNEKLTEQTWRCGVELLGREVEAPDTPAGLLFFAADRHLDAEDNAKAAQLYERAFALDPQVPDAARHWGYGYVLSKLGRRQEALEQARWALRLDPTFSRGRELLNQLEKSPG